MTTRTQLADPRTVSRAAAGRRMTKSEALALNAQIRATARGLWQLVAEAYDRKAWQALGYASWKDYAAQELQVGESRAYQLVDTGRVMKVISEAAGSEDVFETVLVTARETAKIKPHMSTFKKELRAALKDGMDPAAAVGVAIQALPMASPPVARPRHEQPSGIIDAEPIRSSVIEPVRQAAAKPGPRVAIPSPFSNPAQPAQPKDRKVCPMCSGHGFV